MVTDTMLLNGSTWASHTCSSSSSALTIAPSAARRGSQDPELLAGQGESTGAAGGAMPGAVDGEVAVVQDRRRGRRTPGQGAYARHQLGKRERLSEVVVGAELQTVDPLLDLGSGREHQDARSGAGQRAAHLVTVDDGEVPVEHDHVVRRAGGRLGGGGSVEHRIRGDPCLLQPLSDPAGQRHVVLDHQHSHPHSMRRPG